MPTLQFAELTPQQKQEAIDLIQKLEAIDAALAQIQTKRAEFEVKARDRENWLRSEKMKVQNAIRALRSVEIIEQLGGRLWAGSLAMDTDSR